MPDDVAAGEPGAGSAPGSGGVPAREAPDLTVVVPAYNEDARIGDTLPVFAEYLRSTGLEWELIVSDDGSTDRTAAIVDAAAAAEPRIRVVHQTPNRGKGHAVRIGMLAAQGNRILFADADLATPIEEYAKLAAALDAGADIAIGSRDMAGSQLMRRQSALRELGGKAFNRLVRLVAVPGIHDTQCGFKLFTRCAARRVFGACVVDHFAFDVEVLYLARRMGFRIAEVPIRWAHQEGSKVRFVRDAMRMAATLARIRTHRYDVQGGQRAGR